MSDEDFNKPIGKLLYLVPKPKDPPKDHQIQNILQQVYERAHIIDSICIIGTYSSGEPFCINSYMTMAELCYLQTIINAHLMKENWPK